MEEKVMWGEGKVDGWRIKLMEDKIDLPKGWSQNRVKIFYLYNVKIRGREGV